jgi:hypothetical protein
MPMCVAFNSNVISQKGISMHCFPKKIQMFEKFGLLRFVMTECSKHFAADQFSVHLKVAKMRIYNGIKIKPDAKLTIFYFSNKQVQKKWAFIR